MGHTTQLEEALALALKLPPGERLQLVERVVASVEHEIGFVVFDLEARRESSRRRALAATVVADQAEAGGEMLVEQMEDVARAPVQVGVTKRVRHEQQRYTFATNGVSNAEAIVRRDVLKGRRVHCEGNSIGVARTSTRQAWTIGQGGDTVRETERPLTLTRRMDTIQ